MKNISNIKNIHNARMAAEIEKRPLMQALIKGISKYKEKLMKEGIGGQPVAIRPAT